MEYEKTNLYSFPIFFSLKQNSDTNLNQSVCETHEKFFHKPAPTASVFPLQDTGMDSGMIAIGDFTGNASPPQVKGTTASMEDFEMMDAPRAAGGDPQTAAAARGDFEKISEQLESAAADRYKMTADPRG